MGNITSQSTSEPRFLFPAWLKGKWGCLGIIFIVYIVLDLAWTYFHWGGEQHVTLIANVFSFAPSLLATAIAWRAAAHTSLGTPLRRAWLILGTSFGMFLIGNLVWAYLEVVLGVEPFPSLADIFYLSFYPLALWGLLSMPSAPQNRRESLTLWLDLLCVLTAAAMFVVYFIIVPTTAVSSNDLLTQLIAPAYPIGSLLLIGGILAILYRPSSPNTQSALRILLIGMIFFVSGDIAFGYTSLTGTYTIGGWTDANWNIAQLFFGLAALRNMVHGHASAASREWITAQDRLIRWLPPTAVGLGYGLVFYVVSVNYTQTAAWLMAGALLLTLMVIVRQIVSPAFADLPVRVKVILAFILVSILSVILVSAAAYLVIRSNLESVVGESLNADVEVRAQTLGNEISSQMDLMEGFVLGEIIEYGLSTVNAEYTGAPSSIEIQIQNEDQTWKRTPDSDPFVQNMLNNEMARELSEFRNHFPSHSDLLLTDIHGATIAATNRPARYSQADQEWWQAAYNQGRGGQFIGQPIFDPVAQSLDVIIALPVHANHGQDVIGVIRSTFHIQNILEVLTASRLEYDLLLPGGQLLHQHGDMQSLDPATVARFEASQDAAYVELDLEGTRQRVSQALLTSSNADDLDILRNLNWRLIAHEKSSMALAPLHAAWRTALFTTLLVLLLTSGIAVILAQILIAPISRLTRVVAQIAEGDLTTQVPVESRDEIGTLATTFNIMVQALSQTQKELQESELHYRNLVDYSPDMIAVHCYGKYVFINPAGAALLGAKSADELIGRRVLEMIPEEERQRIQLAMEYMTESGEPSPVQHRKMYRVDGTSFEAEFRATSILYAGVPAIQLVTRDVTERKQAEQQIHQLLTELEGKKDELERRVAKRTEDLNALNVRLQIELTERQRLLQSLQESEQRFRLVFDTSPDAIFLIDPHDSDETWKIIDCNPTACEMNGYTRQELVGRTIGIVNAVSGSTVEFASVLEHLRSVGVVRATEATHRHKDGHLFPIEYSTSLITIGERELILGIDRDITERKQTELALRLAKDAAEESRRLAEAANKAKSEFLSRMSHELRTPMNAILGFAQLLTMSRKEPLTSTQNDRVRQIMNGGKHLLDLINEILDISRIESGRLQISPEPVPVRENIQEAIDLTIPLAIERHIQIQSKLKLSSNPFVLADRQRFKQILLNLLSNAVKYNRDGGFILIGCAQTQTDMWRISVTDTGTGISAADREHLFMPFERLSADQTTVEGTGLGLALAKRLVELMKGRIGVDSTPGEGSTFWFELPRTESPLEHLKRTGGTGGLPEFSAKHRTILYVEDNRVNFELIQQVLADYSQINLLWAADWDSGLALAHERRPNLIMLDLHLNGRDGNDLLQQLKQHDRTKNIPVIMVSADATATPMERSMALGALAYLTKPLNVKHFIQHLDELLQELPRKLPKQLLKQEEMEA